MVLVHCTGRRWCGRHSRRAKLLHGREYLVQLCRGRDAKIPLRGRCESGVQRERVMHQMFKPMVMARLKAARLPATSLRANESMSVAMPQIRCPHRTVQCHRGIVPTRLRRLNIDARAAQTAHCSLIGTNVSLY